ncbi:MarR family winged helix-turn-helix transcriptional regulator [Chitinophaga vietnamensis]|uniref:MarR family winged helix-turn-helix transcriptional regulator n=1 Tax=Chitinophaga vietnamensis TaxID=2593957 RepID=UPI0011776D21|nr:MarR family transcriptional regulator [Chitinophaga vietnamensis]
MSTKDLTSSLRTVVSALHKALRRQTTSLTAFSMTELETIGLLHRHGSLLASELAEYTHITTQSMSQVLKKLETMDLIQRQVSDTDKRKAHISLTAAGMKAVDMNRYERDKYLQERIEKVLTEKEIALLEKVIPVLNKLAAVQ